MALLGWGVGRSVSIVRTVSPGMMLVEMRMA